MSVMERVVRYVMEGVVCVTAPKINEIRIGPLFNLI